MCVVEQATNTPVFSFDFLFADRLHLASIGDDGLEKCKRKCTWLYYSSLRTFLVSEKMRTQRTKFTSMLHSEIFHRSLLGVCMALVLHTYATLIDVHSLLQQWELEAIQLLYMIEHYIHHVPRLPEMLQIHLRDIADTIVESVAWERGSMLFSILEVCFSCAGPKFWDFVVFFCCKT